MKLTFPGTRGYIEEKRRRHRRHSCLMVSYRGKEIMIDCGRDWLGKVDELKPRAIFITHAHPDHSRGLENGAPCPVYGTSDTREKIKSYNLEQFQEIKPRSPVTLYDITVEAFSVAHSIRAPAAGFRIRAGRVAIFYVPDVVYIKDRGEALQGTRLYIGDGATVETSFVRKKGGVLYGHTPLRTQLTWCKKEGVPRAVFTHCGEEIVGEDERKLKPRIEKMARERGVEAEIAYDGMELVLR